jgi:hypothetical protein
MATQSASHEKPSSFEAQSRELSSVIEETAPILPFPLEFRSSKKTKLLYDHEVALHEVTVKKKSKWSEGKSI